MQTMLGNMNPPKLTKWLQAKGSPFLASSRSIRLFDSQKSNTISIQEKAQKIRFLLVEDSKFGLSWMKVVLNQIGVVQIGEACDGVEAVKEYIYATEKNQQYDVVLMDLLLPEKDGYQATLEIREYEQKHRLRPTFICGNSAFISKKIQLPEGFD
mmetsp:Transcript_10243/g.10212  ORF Transcript_10243/g.10212 Transcript_10243/m.10212 type:complete len:155 (+) Transcript_10243:604-1068(+)